MGHAGWVASVWMLALAGQAIGYLLAVVLARRLGVDGFEAYVIASATFLTMVAFVPRGFDKLALRLLPPLFESARWGEARGFLNVSIRRTLWASLLVGIVVGLWAWYIRDFTAATRLAIIASCIALPAGALVHLALEVLTAAGRPQTATAIFRLAVPAMTLAFVGMLIALSLPLSAVRAVGCWAIAWTIALALMTISVRKAAPPEVLHAAAVENASQWETEARPFWIYRISLALLGQAGVIALDLLQPAAAVVGAYAAAMGTAAIAQVLATATNRVYASHLSVLLEHREFEALFSLRRKRRRWLAVPLLLYLLGTLIFTRELLALFRPEFVDEGVWALRVLSATTAFTVVLSLAPTYLKFRRRNRAAYTTVAIAAVAQIGLLLLLIPAFGATGAACAYAVASCGMYGAFALMAHGELRWLRRHSQPP